MPQGIDLRGAHLLCRPGIELGVAPVCRSRPLRWVVASLLLLTWRNPVGAQRPSAPLPAATAFVGASVIPMDRERVLSNQTIVIENGRIAALGAVGTVQIT